MNTKSLLQLCGATMVALLPLSTVSAQAAKAPAPTADERVAKMKTDLALSDDQVTKLKAIFDEQKTAAEPIIQDKTLTKDQRKEKMKPIKEAAKTKMNAVLTPEQQAKIKAAKKDKKES